MNRRKYGKKRCHLHTTPWHLHSPKAAKTNAVMATSPSLEIPPLKIKLIIIQRRVQMPGNRKRCQSIETD